MNRLLAFLDKTAPWFFLLSIVLIKIPPFYIFFPIRSTLLTTHSLSRIIATILVIYVCIKNAFNNKKTLRGKYQQLLIIFLIYFLFQSLSIISATNLTSFFQKYKDIIFSGIFLYLAIYFKKENNKIIPIFIAISIFNVIYQLIAFFYPKFFSSLGELFIYEAHFNLVKINLERGRIFTQTFDETTIPFLLFFLQQEKKNNRKLGYLSLIFFILIASLLSNFRVNIIMFFFAFFTSLLVFYPKKMKQIVVIVILFIVTFFMVDRLALNILGYSFFDRLTFQNEQEDVQTVESRISHIGRSIDIGMSRPWFGVGLGNYYEYFPIEKKAIFTFSSWKKEESEISATDPHNIFAQTWAETGIFSLIFFCLFIINFFIEDLKRIFSHRKDIKTATIIAFWTLFLYAVVNPTAILSYNLLFWVLRVMII